MSNFPNLGMNSSKVKALAAALLLLALYVAVFESLKLKLNLAKVASKRSLATKSMLKLSSHGPHGSLISNRLCGNNLEFFQ